MDKTLSFDNFMLDVEVWNRAFVEELDAYFAGHGYKRKLEMAKNGYVISYAHPKTKRVVMNYVFRKAGLMARIYADNLGAYVGIVRRMPESIQKALVKASDCKRLMNPPKPCSPTCPMGAAFELNGEMHKKCRYNCFFMLVNEISQPVIRELVENEVRERAEN